MTIYEQLQNKFDKLPIAEIEKICDSKAKSSLTNRKDFILALHYLRKSGTYKNNPQFKKAAFETYLFQRFNLRLATYTKEEWAFLQFPKESATVGVGCIAKIKQSCGVTKAPKVIQEIMELKKRTHDNIEDVIQKHAKQKPKPEQKSKSKPKTHTPSAQAQEVHIEYRGKIQAYEKQIAEYEDQIAKLKVAVAERDAEIQNLMGIIHVQKKRLAKHETFLHHVDTIQKEFKQQGAYASRDGLPHCYR